MPPMYNTLLPSCILLPYRFFTSTSGSTVASTQKYVKHLYAFSLTPVRCYFNEISYKGDMKYHPKPKRTMFQRIPHGLLILKDECKRWVKEMDELIHQDYKFYEPGDTDVFFRFDKQEDLKKWLVSSDKAHNQGNSECQLIRNDYGKAVFSGVIDKTLPKDGQCERTGYCAIKSIALTKSFFREHSFDWQIFTHLQLRVRGDGRNYVIGLCTNNFIDINWLDLHAYPLHTRGGPYWQVAKIPFSKFFLSHKGCIQDKQYPVAKHKINSISIMCAGAPGPFNLEIDYIGVHYDKNHFEKFAYEMYKMPKEIVS